MAFPAIAATADTQQTSDSSSWTVNMPSGIVAGQLLLAAAASDGSGSSSDMTATGWTSIFQGRNAGQGVHLGVLAKTAAGSDTMTLSIDSAQQGAVRVWRITGAETIATQAPEASADTNAFTSTPDLAACTPTGGAKDYLWFAFAAHAGNASFTSGPTGFTSSSLQGGGSSGAHLGYGYKTENDSSDDPDEFTFGSVQGSHTCTLAVHPGAAGLSLLFMGNNLGKILIR